MPSGCTESQYQNKINTGQSSHYNVNIWPKNKEKKESKNANQKQNKV